MSETITISWEDGNPTAPDISVLKSAGQTNIEWVVARGSGITSFEIQNLNSSEFTGGRASSGTSPTLTVTDLNNSSINMDYTYTISASHNSGTSGQHDPKISNVGR